jgi:hypothetical protein
VGSLARRLATLLVAVAIGAAPAPGALADGDPASDYLLSQQVFLPFDANVTAASSEKLAGVVRASNLDGYRIRVAVIGTRYDLGSVTALWEQPKTYARFLAAEIAFVYKGPLLVVMPNGVGFHAPGSATPAGYRAVAAVRVTPGTPGLMAAATSGVERLAAAHGVHVQPPALAAAAKHGRSNMLPIALGIVGAIAIAAAALFGFRRFGR